MHIKKILYIITMLIWHLPLFTQVAVNTSGNMPDVCSMLDISSTEKGVLIPRLTEVERNSISNPANGLLIYNTNTKKFNYWNENNWVEILGTDITVSQAFGTSTSVGLGITNDNTQPHHSAILEVKGNDGGILIPRMNTIQRNSISSPKPGLIIYNTDVNKFNYYNGLTWIELCGTPTSNQTGTINASFGVSISENGQNPHPSSILDIQSTTKGLLIPRLTNAQRNSILSPAEGLWIYNTETNSFQLYKGANVWLDMGSINLVAPTANNPTLTWPTGFRVIWTNVTGATTYYLDVAYDNAFTNYVVGYQNLNVGNVTSYDVEDLQCGAIYYYRVRAANSCALSPNSNTKMVGTLMCGECGTQKFMAPSNVGSMVHEYTEQNNDTQIEKYCLNNILANCATYGGFYQWAEAIQAPYSANSSSYSGSWATCDPCGSGGRQGICPAGHHIPTDLEFSRYEWCVENNIVPQGVTPLYQFQDYTGYRGSASSHGPGYKMKEKYSTWDGSNASGFSAKPAGYKYDLGGFQGTYTSVYIWTATPHSFDDKAWYRALHSMVYRSERNNIRKKYGMIVRCLQN